MVDLTTYQLLTWMKNAAYAARHEAPPSPKDVRFCDAVVARLEADAAAYQQVVYERDRWRAQCEELIDHLAEARISEGNGVEGVENITDVDTTGDQKETKMTDTKLTRAEMADKVAEKVKEWRHISQVQIDSIHPDSKRRGHSDMESSVIPMEAAVEELRKSCAGCHSFEPPSGGYHVDPYCQALESDCLPYDGSGFCHNWKAKEV